jgi:SAM-dependent methyltransferase
VTLQALADAGLEVHGFEINSAAVRGLDPRIHVHVAESLEAARLPEASFDEVLLWHVLEHIPDPRATLREIHRILRPGGILVVAVPNAASWQARWAGPAWFHLDPPRHLFHFTASNLKRLLASVEFECRSEHHFSLRQNPFGWIQSALNLVPWLPRNSLYALLHRRHDGPVRPPAVSLRKRIELHALLVLLSPAALLLSIAAAICRRGATIHIVATRS